MYKIAKENLPALFQKIAAGQELYLPVQVSGQTNFAAWTEDAQVDLDTLKTVKSPKDAFFPQSENLYTVKREGKKVSVGTGSFKRAEFCSIWNESLRYQRCGSTGQSISGRSGRQFLRCPERTWNYRGYGMS